ncbi:MAG TPA: L,D-transpeptidase family protein, partial [Paracoccaceae bacterium]|nr:L,D-transpeptidase family protein [Paracoccaceae bacterium]
MKAYLAFARDISSGAIEPRLADRGIHIVPARPLAGELLGRLAGPAPRDFFHLAPDSAEYARLVEELARTAELLRAGVFGGPIAEGPSLRLGDRSERVLALRTKLEALGGFGLVPVPPAPAETGAAQPLLAEEDPMVVDEALAEAVRQFQARHGLEPDGVVGRLTLGVLQGATDGRYGQILANLERIRWLHRDLSERHIFVNQANFSMELVENDQALLESRVVVGKTPRFHTPEFVDTMDHLVVNPTWHVPTSIATKEILPLLQRDPTYLERNGYRIVPVGADPVPDGITSHYAQYSIGYFPFRIKQDPSEANALGRVKFMFPNQFSIYLHDTPQKRLFARDVRAFSHGCVRVQRAFDLAYALLEGQVEDPPAAFQRWLDAQRERRIDLDRPVRVYLTYRTVWLDRAGELQFRNDIYGRDAKVLAALEKAGVPVLR